MGCHSSIPTTIPIVINNTTAAMSSSSSAPLAAPSSAAPIEAKVSPAPAAITLKGKVAIVTGASRGIGRGIALTLARDGAKVIVNYQKDVKSADATVAAITLIGGAATAIQADVSSSTDVDRLFAETKKLYGQIDIVVANSGIAHSSSLSLYSNDEFDRMINVNLKGAFYTLRAAANNIQDNGRIILIGSIGGSISRRGVPNLGPYTATKAAIEVLANTAAHELGGRGITVNTVHPGGIDTDMLALSPPSFIKAVIDATPAKRLGTIYDLGDAVSLLASESARWISGQAIVVSGGSR